MTQTFFIEDDIASYYLLDSVITVVDAKHGHDTLDAQVEAQNQVGFADRILLSKTDLVDADEVASLRERIVRMNPRAPIKPVNFGQVPLKEVLDLRGFNLNAILEIDPEFLAAEHPDAKKARRATATRMTTTTTTCTTSTAVTIMTMIIITRTIIMTMRSRPSCSSRTGRSTRPSSRNTWAR